MIYDEDFACQILMYVETYDNGGGCAVPHIKFDPDERTFDRHIDALILDGLLRLEGRVPDALVVSITWRGHCFVRSHTHRYAVLDMIESISNRLDRYFPEQAKTYTDNLVNNLGNLELPDE